MTCVHVWGFSPKLGSGNRTFQSLEDMVLKPESVEYWVCNLGHICGTLSH